MTIFPFKNICHTSVRNYCFLVRIRIKYIRIRVQPLQVSAESNPDPNFITNANPDPSPDLNPGKTLILSKKR
jgi:hypothetical protein